MTYLRCRRSRLRWFHLPTTLSSNDFVQCHYLQDIPRPLPPWHSTCLVADGSPCTTAQLLRNPQNSFVDSTQRLWIVTVLVNLRSHIFANQIAPYLPCVLNGVCWNVCFRPRLPHDLRQLASVPTARLLWAAVVYTFRRAIFGGGGPRVSSSSQRPPTLDSPVVSMFNGVTVVAVGSPTPLVFLPLDPLSLSPFLHSKHALTVLAVRINTHTKQSRGDDVKQSTP